jgi:hypothetical protein
MDTIIQLVTGFVSDNWEAHSGGGLFLVLAFIYGWWKKLQASVDEIEKIGYGKSEKLRQKVLARNFKILPDSKEKAIKQAIFKKLAALRLGAYCSFHNLDPQKVKEAVKDCQWDSVEEKEKWLYGGGDEVQSTE